MNPSRLLIALTLVACGGAYYEEPMETEVVLVQQPAEQPTVVVADPGGAWAAPGQPVEPQVVQPQVVQPQVVQVQPQAQVVQVHATQPIGPRIVSGPPPPQASACLNACRSAHDGEGADGRPGAHTSRCDYGSDCNDCGPAAAQATPATLGGGCSNTCRHANDGECDDGRPGAHTSLCAYGSDCGDCGPG